MTIKRIDILKKDLPNFSEKEKQQMLDLCNVLVKTEIIEYNNFPTGMIPPILLKNISELFKNNGSAITLWDNDLLVAICMVRIVQLNGCKGISLSFIVVNEKYRCKGYARLLIKSAHEFGKKNGCELACLNVSNFNPKAEKLYKLVGYTPVQTAMFRKI